MSRTTQEQDQQSHIHFKYGTITLWGRTSQFVLLYICFVTLRKLNADPVLQPRKYCYQRFGLLPFRSPLLRESQEPSS
jgi:hypothetical protein